MSLSLKKFLMHDEDGAVAVIFSLSLVVLTIAIGLAVDYSRALSYYDRTQIALDAASLAVSKAAANGSTDAELVQLAQNYFDQAMKGTTGVTFSKVNVALDQSSNEAQVRVEGHVRTMIGKVIGIESIDKELLSAATSSNKSIELGMMLDVSGSMKGAKIAALKSAAKDLVDTLTAGSSETRKARIGIVPYSTSVNLGPYAEAAKGKSGKGEDDENTCVSERKGSHAFTDSNPKAGGPMGRKAFNCPNSVVQPLNDDKDAVKEAIDALHADGSTAGHLGIAWAWYMVSEKWRDFWPQDRAPEETDEKLLKAVVLMTDGEFNTEYERDNGKSAQQAEKLCANMKAEGVMIFTVAFDAPDEVLPLFAECASIPAYAFQAKDGAALKKSFGRIAQYLSDLRIAR